LKFIESRRTYVGRACSTLGEKRKYMHNFGVSEVSGKMILKWSLGTDF
jgi:hypothetical protein